MEEKIYDVVIINDEKVVVREHKADENGEHTVGCFNNEHDAKINAAVVRRQMK